MIQLADRELPEDGDEGCPGSYPPETKPNKENKEMGNKKRMLAKRRAQRAKRRREKQYVRDSIEEKDRFVNTDLYKKEKKDTPTRPTPPKSSKLSKLSKLSLSKGLLTGEVPKTEWLVEDLLGTGFLTIAGAGKSGKTLLALQLASTVTTGGAFLGHSVEQREVLFIQLEMGRGTMKQYALKQGLPGAEEITFIWNNKETRGHLTKENILKEVKGFIETTKGTCLVIIDSLAKLDPYLDHDSAKAIIPLYGELKDLVIDTRASILLIDHANKSIHRSDSNSQAAISGSSHKTSGTDGYMVLRERGKKDTRSLYIDGYFPSGDVVITLDTSTLLWAFAGEADEVSLQEKYAVEIEAIKKLKENATHKEIVRETGYTKGYVSRRLKDAISDGVIHLEEKVYKVY